MKKKQLHLVSLFHFNSNIAGKDMFLTPMYLGKNLNATVEFVYPKTEFNNEFKGKYRGVKLTPIRSNSQYYCNFWSEKEMGWWLIRNARKIDILSLFWLNSRNIIFAQIYKLLNPKGICYIKGDFNEINLSNNTLKKKRIKYSIKKILYTSVDVISTETRYSLELLKKGILGKHIAQHSIYLPNGFDIDFFKTTNIKVKSFKEKENLIITVGRIGSKQKNNELLLRTIDRIDLGNWKILLIGPIEDSFKKIYNNFIIRNPDKKNKVLLMGPINDKKELWEFYNRAKIFILTSTFEGFANVYPEALYFGNYIITTKVGGSNEISENGQIGKLIDITQEEFLKKHLSMIINGELNISDNYRKAILLSKNKFVWEKVTLPVSKLIKEIYEAKNH